MKISTVLDHIDSGRMALPEFQHRYVWNRDQVRGLFDSLYRRHPVGGLLVWATESKTATHRGDGPLTAGVVKLLLDGQQRITSLYGVVRGKPPKFFDGNVQAFTALRFHLDTEAFGFYQPLKMQDDPLWIDLTALMQNGHAGLGEFVARLSQNPAHAAKVGEYVGRMGRLLGILEVDLHVEEVTGADKSLDVVVDIFNRVNSGGTKLSKGDLALAKICADWPEARDTMRQVLQHWTASGYHFTLDWLLRSVNTVLTGEAKFSFLHEKIAEEVQEALRRATQGIDTCLNLISGRLGLDHDDVLFGRFAIPVMVRYLDQRGGPLDARERDRLLFWFVQAGMWGRFSGSTESYIDQDLAALEGEGDAIEKLLDQLRLWHGSLRVEAGHFTGWSLGARFYPVLYLLTRLGEARDWKIEHYRDFLAARQELLAAETNRRMAALLHGDTRWLEGAITLPAAPRPVTVLGGITGAAEEEALMALNDWVEAQGLPRGQMSFDDTDPDTGVQRAVFDLAWLDGVQAGLSQPVAVLLNEGEETLALASSVGFRCFTDVEAFKGYVIKEVLREALTARIRIWMQSLPDATKLRGYVLRHGEASCAHWILTGTHEHSLLSYSGNRRATR